MVDAALVNPWMLAADAALHPHGGDRDNAHETRRVPPKVGYLQGVAPCSAHEVRTDVPSLLTILPWAMSLVLPILPCARSMTVWHAG